jgi:hypothetical protein
METTTNFIVIIRMLKATNWSHSSNFDNKRCAGSPKTLKGLIKTIHRIPEYIEEFGNQYVLIEIHKYQGSSKIETREIWTNLSLR